MNRDRRDLELAGEGALVEGLDVRELVHVAEIAGIELVLGQGVEYERVVGVGRVRDANGAGHDQLPVLARALMRKSSRTGLWSAYSRRPVRSSAASCARKSR